VLDTSAFLAGFDPFSVSEKQFTCPTVEDEIRANSISWVRFKAAAENGKVKVKMPSEEYRNKVTASAKKVGDAFFLSETDIELLALASELKAEGCTPQIVTDDYSIQNVATQLGIEFVALATFGISRLLEWIRYCPACYRKYPADYKSTTCEVCGTDLKRKPRRTSKEINGIS
jgi:endoribonuclease Nob1